MSNRAPEEVGQGGGEYHTRRARNNIGTCGGPIIYVYTHIHIYIYILYYIYIYT